MSVSLGYVIFYVPDVGGAVDFYVDAFGLEKRLLTPEGDYGELATGETTLAFVSEELAEVNLGAAGGYTRLDPSRPPVAVAVALTLLSDDVSQALNVAVMAGATVYVEPTQKPWGQTVAYLIDPFGILVEVATPVTS